jgi:hypothetical protein
MTTKFLSADELGITELEHKYLLKTYDVLQENRRRRVIQVPNDGRVFFSMAHV